MTVTLQPLKQMLLTRAELRHKKKRKQEINPERSGIKFLIHIQVSENTSTHPVTHASTSGHFDLRFRACTDIDDLFVVRY